MSVSKKAFLWIGVGFVLAALAVPWFMWETSRVVAGLPAWVWWHVGWLALTAVVFAVFARTAWGVGVGVRGGTDG